MEQLEGLYIEGCRQSLDRVQSRRRLLVEDGPEGRSGKSGQFGDDVERALFLAGELAQAASERPFQGASRVAPHGRRLPRGFVDFVLFSAQDLYSRFFGIAAEQELASNERAPGPASARAAQTGRSTMNAAAEESLAFAQARVGTTLNGKWRLDRLLGVGGMASVYEATHRNRKRAAVKMLHPELSLHGTVRERFLREGYVANSVGHPGAVAVDDDDVAEDGCAFLVMELLDGETLDARWERKGKHLPADEVLSLADQVLSTLSAAHAAGIIHRDLKPENLFLTRTGVVKVLDFGIARVRELSQSSSKTQTGSMMGTPSFMPPEQARGRWDEVDAQSDIWAVGATMFTLLTGRYVHEAGTVNEALAFGATQPARSIATLLPELPFPVVELVDRALSYDKSARWTSAATMQTALRRAYAGLEAAALAAGAEPLKPITLETFDDSTVALATTDPSGRQTGDPSRPANVSVDIPPSTSLPAARPNSLTTARGVTHGALEGARRTGRKTVHLTVLAVVVGATLAGVWLGLGSHPPSGEAAPQGSTTLFTKASSRQASAPSPPDRTQAEPARVSIDDLPAVAPHTPESSAGKRHVELQSRRTPTASGPAVPSARPAPSSTPLASHPRTDSDDPFASRR